MNGDPADFQGEDCVLFLDPDTKLVDKISPSFWKLENGSIIPMNKEEQEEVESVHKNENVITKIDPQIFDERVSKLIKLNNQAIDSKILNLLETQEIRFAHMVGELTAKLEEAKHCTMEVSLRMKKLETLVMVGFITGVITAIGIIAEVFFGF